VKCRELNAGFLVYENDAECCHAQLAEVTVASGIGVNDLLLGICSFRRRP
jgi:hypothetical protein